MIYLTVRRLGFRNRDGDHRRIIGVARLLTAAFGNTGELALIVADPWQGLGLGSKLVDNLLDISRDKELETVTANMRSENRRVVELLTKKGFALEDLQDGTIKAVLTLRG